MIDQCQPEWLNDIPNLTMQIIHVCTHMYVHESEYDRKQYISLNSLLSHRNLTY